MENRGLFFTSQGSLRTYAVNHNTVAFFWYVPKNISKFVEYSCYLLFNNIHENISRFLLAKRIEVPLIAYSIFKKVVFICDVYDKGSKLLKGL